MPVQTMVDCEFLVGGLDLGFVANVGTLELDADALDVTRYASGGWAEQLPGLRSGVLSIDGYADHSPVLAGGPAPDADMFALAASGQPVSVTASSAAGAVAYVGLGRRGSLSMFGQVGDVSPASATVWTDGPVGRGQLLVDPAARTASGTGAQQWTAGLTAGRQLHCAVHVLSAGGTSPSLTVTFQRGAAGFASPTTLATVGPFTAAGGQITTVAWPTTTDDRIRAVWTITGTTPTFRFAATAGVI